MISGVITKKISRHHDDRGWLAELYRKDFDKFQAAMSYISFTKFNAVRGPHEHREQTDFFVFIGPGDFELYLWDNRETSKTYSEKMKMTVGESNKVTVLVPPGVVHGYKSISQSGGICLNFPSRLYAGEYKKQEVDEIRHEEDSMSSFKIK